MKERKVGEVFEADGVKLKVVECSTHKHCFYLKYGANCHNNKGTRNIIGPCDSSLRKDNLSVIFEEVK